MAKRISLKDDLAWREVQNLQQVMMKADFWEGFPEDGLRLVTAEVKSGDENQRIDLLYLRDDGAIFPTELKVGGREYDSHGQLIRYLADLNDQPITREWVLNHRKEFLKRKYAESENHEQNVMIDLQEFEEKISNIDNKNFKLLKNSGILIDENFPSQLTSAVKFLNRDFQFAIRLIHANAYVADDWTKETIEFGMRLDLTEVMT